MTQGTYIYIYMYTYIYINIYLSCFTCIYSFHKSKHVLIYVESCTVYVYISYFCANPNNVEPKSYQDRVIISFCFPETPA